MFKVSKSRWNPASVWKTWNTCCVISHSTPDCCVEKTLRTQKPNGGGVLSFGSPTFNRSQNANVGTNYGSPIIAE